MSLNAAQIATLKADITANSAQFGSIPNTLDGAFAIAAAYNLPASPDFYVWRTSLSLDEVVSRTLDDSTAWSWTTYLALDQAHRDCWRDMFSATGSVNPSLANLRAGMSAIFGAGAQLTFLAAVAKRTSSRIEKVLSTGTGSSASPAVMGYEGQINYNDVYAARNS